MTRLQGRCWKLGDDVSSDLLISARHVFEYDPPTLARHLLEEHLEGFAQAVRPGDLLVAGRRFAHGSQHSHPFLAMKALGVGLLARSLARPPYRLAVYMGVPLLEIDGATYDALQDGEPLAVDFDRGAIEAGGRRLAGEPLPAFLRDIVAAGGGLPWLREQHARTT